MYVERIFSFHWDYRKGHYSLSQSQREIDRKNSRIKSKAFEPCAQVCYIGLTDAENITVCFRKRMHPQRLKHGTVRYSRSEDTTW